MEIKVKKEVEETITIPVPSYWKKDEKFVNIISEENSVTVMSCLGIAFIQLGSPVNKIDETFEQISQVEFLKAYNQAHEAIEELVTSVGEVAK